MHTETSDVIGDFVFYLHPRQSIVVVVVVVVVAVAASAAAAVVVSAEDDDKVDMMWLRDADTFATMQLVVRHDLID